MARKVWTLFSISLILVLTTSCTKDLFDGSDNIITITRELSTFNKVIVQDDLDVNVVQSNSQNIEIIVNDNLQDQITTKVSGNVLIISLKSGSYKNEIFEVNIEMPELRRLQLDDNTRAKVDFVSTEIEFEVNGSSTLTLEGAADVLNTSVNDDGKISGFSFTTQVINTKSRDASELEIICSNELNGTVNDASKVSYRGMPAINAQTSDIGQIINAN